MKLKVVLLSVFVALSLISGFASAQSALFGVTYEGGEGGLGTIFRTDNNGSNQVVIKEFTSDHPGAIPEGEAIAYGADEIIGMTSTGGAYNKGIIYRYNTVTGVYAKVWDFDGAGGDQPKGHLLITGTGKIFGMTRLGGANNGGVLFEYNPLTDTVIIKHDFVFASGIEPQGSLTEAPNGLIYGFAYRGGTFDNGVLFQFDPNSGIYNPFYIFPSNGLNGENPVGEPAYDPLNDLLIGVTENGGANGLGTIFVFSDDTLGFSKVYDMTPAGGGNCVSALVHNNSTPGLFLGQSANYGANGEGTVFTFDNSNQTFTNIHDFDGTGGGDPRSRLVPVSGGLWLGTTYSGGADGFGVVFSIDVSGNTFTILDELDFFGLGANAACGLIKQGDHFYLPVSKGGEPNVGMLLRCDTLGQNFSSLFVFNAAGADGGYPEGELFVASDGFIYGSTTKGGASNSGVIFRIDPANNGFTKVADMDPIIGSECKGVLADYNGSLYGLAYSTSVGVGSLFSVDLSQPFPATPQLVLAFSNNVAAYPRGGLVQGNDGRFWGLSTQGGGNSNGAMFTYNPATGSFLDKHDFLTATGSEPSGNVVQAPNGFYYGFACQGGTNGQGTIFKFNSVDSLYTVVHNFTGVQGGVPCGSPVFTSDGTMYGMTRLGGLNNKGVLFSFNTASGTFTLVQELTSADGANPVGSLVYSDLGRLYGATAEEGANGGGTFFELTTIGAFTKKFDFIGTNGYTGLSTMALQGCGLPQIAQQPVSATACSGSSVSFVSAATGSGLNYQWYKDGTVLSGETSATILLDPVSPSDSGYYHCVIHNACGYVLTVYSKLTISSKPASFIVPGGPPIVCENNPITILNTNSGTGLTWQWNLNGTPIAGANASSYNPFQTGNYTVTVSSGIGCDSTSNPLAFTAIPVVPGVAVNISPVNPEVCGLTSVSFSSSAFLAGSNPFYQWMLNGNPVAGETGTSYSAVLGSDDFVQLLMFPDTCALNDTIYSNGSIAADTCLFTLPLADNAYCANEVIPVTYEFTSPFNVANLMTVELSDATGSFASAQVIGALATTAETSQIQCQVPSNVPAGSAYRIRVMSSDPPLIGLQNGNALTLGNNDLSLSYTASPNPVTSDTMNVTFQNTTPGINGLDFTWHFGDGLFVANDNASVIHTYPNNGVYYPALFATDPVTGCSDTLYNPNNPANVITVNVPGSQNCNLAISHTPPGFINACQGGSVLLSTNPPPNTTVQWLRNGVLLPGQNASQMNATLNGFYSVNVVDTNAGCFYSSVPSQVIFGLPPVAPPVISSSGQIGLCGTINATLTASGGFASYLWSNGQTGASIPITQGGAYTVVGLGNLGCDAVSAPFVVTGSLIPPPEICMVTVSDDNLHNEVIWTMPTITNSIDSFVILRGDDALAGVYQRIGAVDFDSSDPEAIFIDSTAEPNERAYWYKVAIKDDCGGMSVESSPVRTMFLLVNPYLGTDRYLTWNTYEGAAQNIEWYRVYSGADLNNLNLIDSVFYTSTYFIDPNPTFGTSTAYRIETKLSTSCDDLRAQRGRSVSNGTGNLLQYQSLAKSYLDDNHSVFVFPNPNNGSFYLVLKDNLMQASWSLTDLAGKEVLPGASITNPHTLLDLQLSSGMYLLKVKNYGSIITRRIIIE